MAAVVTIAFLFYIALSAISNVWNSFLAVYKTRWFNRWARRQGLGDLALCDALEEVKCGLFEVELGGHLLKKRIARPGQGKRGGFRTLIATNKGSL